MRIRRNDGQNRPDHGRGSAQRVLTLWLALGFDLTVAATWLMPSLVPRPVLGVLAILRPKSSPGAARIAGGRGCATGLGHGSIALRHELVDHGAGDAHLRREQREAVRAVPAGVLYLLRVPYS